jgi:DNA-binding NarL/FixJ family response regulator
LKRSSAVETCRDVHPDVVLLDVQLPGEDGFAVARRLRDAEVGVDVVLTSSRDWSHAGDLLAQTGARGFVQKHDLSGAAIAALIS